MRRHEIGAANRSCPGDNGPGGKITGGRQADTTTHTAAEKPHLISQIISGLEHICGGLQVCTARLQRCDGFKRCAAFTAAPLIKAKICHIELVAVLCQFNLLGRIFISKQPVATNNEGGILKHRQMKIASELKFIR